MKENIVGIILLTLYTIVSTTLSVMSPKEAFELFRKNK